jgi:hypothetical protein
MNIRLSNENVAAKTMSVGLVIDSKEKAGDNALY